MVKIPTHNVHIAHVAPRAYVALCECQLRATAREGLVALSRLSAKHLSEVTLALKKYTREGR